jgi:hypothetical protein
MAVTAKTTKRRPNAHPLSISKIGNLRPRHQSRPHIAQPVINGMVRRPLTSELAVNGQLQRVLKGHGFSRAAEHQQRQRAFSP